jgi:hypothetical protein
MFHDKKDLARKLKAGEKEYGERRLHFAFEGKTPVAGIPEFDLPSPACKGSLLTIAPGNRNWHSPASRGHDVLDLYVLNCRRSDTVSL